MLTALERAERTFGKARLHLPPIPPRFAPELRECSEWCFASRAIAGMGMYFFDIHLYEALTGRTDDYVAFSHAGHGINSYAITYHLVDGPIVLMVQAPFGGVYMDAVKKRQAIAAQFDRCKALSLAVQGGSRPGTTRRGGRLFVFESLMRGLFAWGWLDHPLGDEQSARDWIDQRAVATNEVDRVPKSGSFPTTAALKWLTTN